VWIAKRLEGARWSCPRCGDPAAVAIWFDRRLYARSWARCTKCRWRQKFRNFRDGVDLATELGAPGPH
jgi:hypothetical protein